MDDVLFELVVTDALKNTLVDTGFHFVLAEGHEIDVNVTLPEMREGYGQEALERDISMALAGAESLDPVGTSAMAIRYMTPFTNQGLSCEADEYGLCNVELLDEISAAENLSEKLPAEEGDAVKRMLTFAKKALFEDYI